MAHPQDPKRKKKKDGRYNPRAHRFRLWQKLFKSNRRILSSCILTNTSPETPSDTPPIDLIEQEYNNIFGDPSPADDEGFEVSAADTNGCYAPINLEDLKASALRRLVPIGLLPRG